MITMRLIQMIKNNEYNINLVSIVSYHSMMYKNKQIHTSSRIALRSLSFISSFDFGNMFRPSLSVLYDYHT